MKILIAIKTCHANAERAHSQRVTWVPEVKEFADVRFFLGAPKFPDYAGPELDEIWLHDVQDDYRGLPEKAHRIIQWSDEREYDWTVMLDDDVYIAPKRFPDLPLMGDYVGRFRGPCGGYPAYFSSGFCYFLSHRSVSAVARTPLGKDWMDERFVANALAFHGIYGYTDPVNYLVTGPHLEGRAVINRAVLRSGTVFCEYKTRSAMLSMHEVLKDRPPVPGHPGLRPVTASTVSVDQLYAPPTDSIPKQKRTWE